mgnify:CR=1 FL=1
MIHEESIALPQNQQILTEKSQLIEQTKSKLFEILKKYAKLEVNYTVMFSSGLLDLIRKLELFLMKNEENTTAAIKFLETTVVSQMEEHVELKVSLMDTIYLLSEEKSSELEKEEADVSQLILTLQNLIVAKLSPPADDDPPKTEE